jgi:hypothetical protein
LSPEGVALVECEDSDDDGRGTGWDIKDEDGSSKICKVLLSLVTAKREEDGEMAREKMVALSIPLRSSVIGRPVEAENTRIKVPFEESAYTVNLETRRGISV